MTKSLNSLRKYFQKVVVEVGINGISEHKWHTIKRNAKIRKLEFNITIDYAWDLFQKQKGYCALSGIPIKLKDSINVAVTRGICEEDTASLGCKNYNFGYIENNVQWVHRDFQKMNYKL